MKSRLIIMLIAAAFIAAPALATTVTLPDANEPDITDAYDIELLTIAKDATNLTIAYQLYDDVAVDPISSVGAQVTYILWFDVPGFDQNPGINPQTPAGSNFDFSVRWHGEPQVSGNEPLGTWRLLTEDEQTVLASGTVLPVGDTLTIEIPLVDFGTAFDNTGTSGLVVYTAYGQLENGDASPPIGEPDDIVFAVIPEPITVMSVLFGVAGLGGYIRRRRR